MKVVVQRRDWQINLLVKSSIWRRKKTIYYDNLSSSVINRATYIKDDSDMIYLIRTSYHDANTFHNLNYIIYKDLHKS